MLETAAHRVQPRHLAREACRYVRQSSLKQVAANAESAHRQYDLRRAALALGWNEDRIRVIDDDQGLSGAYSANRSGFQDLMARIAAGEVGIVLSLEVSRLARDNCDWARLVQYARLADTLILDESGVHDPNDSSDKLLLDIKGSLSEFELAGIRARLLGGQRSKAARGELRVTLPLGLVYDDDGRVVFDPDREVVAALRRVFTAFRDKGSAMQVVKWFRNENILLPHRARTGPCRGELRWSLPDHPKIRRILRNPAYAGAYAYGKTRVIRQVDGSARYRTLPMEQWAVCIPNHHAGFIDWEEYGRNLAAMARNSRCFAASPAPSSDGDTTATCPDSMHWCGGALPADGQIDVEKFADQLLACDWRRSFAWSGSTRTARQSVRYGPARGRGARDHRPRPPFRGKAGCPREGNVGTRRCRPVRKRAGLRTARRCRWGSPAQAA